MAQTLLFVGSDQNEVKTIIEKEASQVSSSFDTLVLNCLENKGVEFAREIIKLAFRKPYNSKILTLILLNAEYLTLEAQNTLLKILEEPPKETQIILTAKNKNRLLPTVVSRCWEKVIQSRTTDSIQKVAFSNFFELSFGERLEILEKNGLENYLAFLEELLLKQIQNPQPNFTLREITSKIKLVLKLIKAGQNSANKKLLALISAQN